MKSHGNSPDSLSTPTQKSIRKRVRQQIQIPTPRLSRKSMMDAIPSMKRRRQKISHPVSKVLLMTEIRIRNQKENEPVELQPEIINMTIMEILEQKVPDHTKWDACLKVFGEEGIDTIGDILNKTDNDWDEIEITDLSLEIDTGLSLKEYLSAFRKGTQYKNSASMDKRNSIILGRILDLPQIVQTKWWYRAKTWAFIAATLSFLTVINVPLSMFFYPTIDLHLLSINYMIDMFFVADLVIVRIVIKMLKPLKRNEQTRKDINLYYHDIFYLDACACIPIELVGVAFGYPAGSFVYACLRIPKLIRCHRLRKTRRFVHRIIILKLLRILGAFVLFGHLLTCLFYGVSKFQPEGGNRWTGDAFIHESNILAADMITKYITCFWWAMMTMLTADGNSMPNTKF